MKFELKCSFTILLVCNFVLKNLSQQVSSYPWVWICDGVGEDAKCVKEKSTNATEQMSLDTCKLTCSPYGSTFPRPQNAVLGSEIAIFVPSNINYTSNNADSEISSMVSSAISSFIETIEKYHPAAGEGSVIWGTPADGKALYIEFDIPGIENYPFQAVDESYAMNVTTQTRIEAKIVAPTFFGARHALETLSQMIAFYEEESCLQVVSSAVITDAPEFEHRGILLDTARNFIPVDDIKRTLDGMSYNKLNVFHWHITDSQSFPLALDSVSEMAQFGATSPENVYTPQDVRDIVEYARLRGIRILPELDSPAHMGHGWQWGEDNGLGTLVLCLDKQPWTNFCAGPPCGQLNLANDNIYVVLDRILKEMAELFAPIDMFHYGGDEIVINCWNTSAEMTDWMEQNGNDLTEEAYVEQWAIFHERVRVLLNNYTQVPGVLWTSLLTSEENLDMYLDKDEYIIQIWTHKTNAVIGDLLRKGYRVIFSNYDSLYLDCGSASWTGTGVNWCSPYKGWQHIYDNDIVAISDSEAGVGTYNRSQILGGEVTLWTEQVDANTMDNKFWPRASAHAERLWVNPVTDYSKAEGRILEHRRRLVTRGLHAERLQPEWCRQNEGECPLSILN